MQYLSAFKLAECVLITHYSHTDTSDPYMVLLNVRIHIYILYILYLHDIKVALSFSINKFHKTYFKELAYT